MDRIGRGIAPGAIGTERASNFYRRSYSLWCIGLFSIYLSFDGIFRSWPTGKKEGLLTFFGLRFSVCVLAGFFLLQAAGRLLGPSLPRRAGKWASVASYAFLLCGLAYFGYVCAGNISPVTSSPVFSDFLLWTALFSAVSVLSVFIGAKLDVPYGVSILCLGALTVAAICSYYGFHTALLRAALHFSSILLLGRLFHALVVRRLLPLDTPKSLSGFYVFYFPCGIAANYFLWYFIGIFDLYFKAVGYIVYAAALCLNFLVEDGFIGHVKTALRSRNPRPAPFPFRQIIRRDLFPMALLTLSSYASIYLLFSMLLPYPGTDDSACRAYISTIDIWANLHGISFLPFRPHFPIVFQPMLFEMTGMPVYLVGDLKSLRIFHFLLSFSAVPFLVWAFDEVSGLSRGFMPMALFLSISSSFSFHLMTSDKPEVLAFPAYLSLLCVCLATLKNGWRRDYLPLLLLLFSIVSVSKSLFVVPAFTTCVLLGTFTLAAGSRDRADSGIVNATRYRAGVLAFAFVLFVTLFAVTLVQNICLRGNPIHPFLPGIFTSSLNYPDELWLPGAPDNFYRQSMPRWRLGLVSGMNLDPSRGEMYRPELKKEQAQAGWPLFAQCSINIGLIWAAVSLPAVLWIKRSTLLFFFSVNAVAGFLAWFVWIGDHMRYSLFFPSMVIFVSVFMASPLVIRPKAGILVKVLSAGLLLASLPQAVLPVTINNSIDYSGGKERLSKAYASLSKLPDRDFFRKEREVLKNPVTQYLRRFESTKPRLLKSDGIKPCQFNCYQPSVDYVQNEWVPRMRLAYVAAFEPTHLLTDKAIAESNIMKDYGFLRQHVELDREFVVQGSKQYLYRFRPDTPWRSYLEEFGPKENYSPAVADYTARFRKRMEDGG